MATQFRPGPGTALRAAWAHLDGAPLRAAVGRGLGAVVPERPAPPAEGGAVRLAGRLRIDPMSGAVLAGGRPFALRHPGAPPLDWLVQAFGARGRVEVAAPLWFGPAGPEAVAEALARAVALARLAPEAVALIPVRLGRLPAMQDALAAGVFAPAPVRVQPRDKVIEADRVVWLTAPSPQDRAEAARRFAERSRGG